MIASAISAFAAVVAFAAAGFLMWHDKIGWGWLIFAGIIAIMGATHCSYASKP